MIFDSYKPFLKQELTTFLQHKKQGGFSLQQQKIFDLLEQFMGHGKFLRATLFLATLLQEKTPSQIDPQWVAVALSLEFSQAFFLIHDDIMDQSPFRRGLRSVHESYRQRLEKIYPSIDFRHHGESLAICTGDLALFLAQEILALHCHQHPFFGEMMVFLNQEWGAVCLHQIDDIFLGLKPFRNQNLEGEILSLYTGKTARYTFSVPLKMATFFSSELRSFDQSLFDIGTQLGIIFQIQNDLLDLMKGQDDQDLFQSKGKDLMEGKKTFYLYWLYQKMNEEEKTFLDSLIGQEEISKEHFKKVNQLLIKHNIFSQVESLKEKLFQQAQEIIKNQKNFPLWLNLMIQKLLKKIIQKSS